MDIFLRGFPVSCTEKEVEIFIRPYLNKLDIFIYYFQKIKVDI